MTFFAHELQMCCLDKRAFMIHMISYCSLLKPDMENTRGLPGQLDLNLHFIPAKLNILMWHQSNSRLNNQFDNKPMLHTRPCRRVSFSYPLYEPMWFFLTGACARVLPEGSGHCSCFSWVSRGMFVEKARCCRKSCSCASNNGRGLSQLQKRFNLYLQNPFMFLLKLLIVCLALIRSQLYKNTASVSSLNIGQLYPALEHFLQLTHSLHLTRYFLFCRLCPKMTALLACYLPVVGFAGIITCPQKQLVILVTFHCCPCSPPEEFVF